MRRALVVALVLAGGSSSTARRTSAQPLDTDPCHHVVGQTDINACWAREAERAESEMAGVYQALLGKLPSRASSNLEKAQKLWGEFRDAHLAVLYGVENPFEVWGREYPMCVSISRYVMARARTRELRKLLEPAPDTVCPL